MRSIPATVSELTPEWLTDVLAQPGSLAGARVTTVDASPIGGNGLMSKIVRLRLAYDADVANAPRSLIAKLPPPDASVRAAGVELGFFKREALFYGELAEHSAIRTPRCYFTRYEADSGAFLTLLEDLSDWRLGDIAAGCSAADGAEAIRALADLHAAWWNSEALTRLVKMNTARGALDQELAMFGEAWPGFESRFGRELGGQGLQTLVAAHLRLVADPGAVGSGPVSLLHGDYKLDNMFFDAGQGVAVFDWGTTMIGPAAFDVAYFLGLNFEPAERRGLEVELLRAYSDRLTAARGIAYGYERCANDYGLQLVAYLPRLVCAGGLAEFAGEQARLRYLVGLRRAIAAVEDHRTLERLA